MKKQIFGLALLFFVLVSMCLLALSASAATNISTADELIAIMNDSSKFATSYKLTADIDLSTYTGELSQKPIGWSSKAYYHATFDGDGHSITGLDIDTGSTGYAGLFGYVYTTTVIKNLKVYGSVSSTGDYTGGLIGVAKGACTISNVEMHVTVSGAGATGGVIGATAPYNSKTIKISGVKNYGNVTGTHYVGGVIGWQNPGGTGTVTFTNVTNYGTITATDSTGGCAGIYGCIKPAGASTATTHTLTNVQNDGAISGTKFVGGIIGNVAKIDTSATPTITISGATNTGTVTGSSTYVAGIVANVTVSNGLTVSVTNATNAATGTISGAGYAGGIFGCFETTNSTVPDAALSITNSVNEGSVTSTASFAGGILAYFSYSVVSANYSADTVRRSTIDTCENRGAVRATAKYAGGIIGCFGNNSGSTNVPMTCSKVSNRGSITADGSFAAGIVGLSRSNIEAGVEEKVVYTDCVNYGTIDAPYGAAGIIGATTVGTYPFYLTNCFNAGTLPATSTHATYEVHPIDSKTSDASPLSSNNYYSGAEDTAEIHGSYLADPTVQASFVGFDFVDDWAMGAAGPEIRAFHTHTINNASYSWSYDSGAGKYYVPCLTCGSPVADPVDEPTVYVHGTSGNDANSGLTADAAVKTLSAAVSHVTANGGTVRITSYTLSANETLPSWNGVVTFTANTFDSNGAATSGITVAKQGATLTMGGHAKFDGILIKGKSSTVYRMYIAANWNDLDIGYVRVQTYATAYIYAGPASITGTDTAAKTVALNLDMPAMSNGAGEYFYERIYLGGAIASASADIENKNVSLTVNDGYINSKASTRTQSGTINTVYAMSTTNNSGRNAAIVDGCTTNVTIGGDVVVNNFRTGDAGAALYPAAVALDSLTVTLNDNATVGSFLAKNVVDGTVTLSTEGRTTKQATALQFIKVGPFAEESAALTMNYDTHCFAPTLSPYYTATGYTVTDNGVDVCTWDRDVTDTTVSLYTCACGRTKPGDTFVYDGGAFSKAVTRSKYTGLPMSYEMNILARAYVADGKTVEYYGIAMIPTDDAWSYAGENDYVVKNAASIESGATFHAKLSNIPAADADTDVYAWAFVKYEDDATVYTAPIGVFNVSDCIYTPAVED